MAIVISPIARIPKQALHAALGARDWRYDGDGDGDGIRAFDLHDTDFPERERSARLADLPIAALNRFLEMRPTLSHSLLLDLWQLWLREPPS